MENTKFEYVLKKHFGDGHNPLLTLPLLRRCLINNFDKRGCVKILKSRFRFAQSPGLLLPHLPSLIGM